MARSKLSVMIAILIILPIINPYISLTSYISINNVEIYLNINYGRNLTYNLNSDLILTGSKNISSIKVCMTYNKLQYKYTSMITYTNEFYYKNNVMKMNYSWKREELNIVRLKGNKYSIYYRRSIIYNSNVFSNISTLMKIRIIGSDKSPVLINSTIEIRTTHLEDIFQFNITVMLFRNMVRKGSITTKYFHSIGKYNITYNIGLVNITNAELDLSSISEKLFRYYLGSYTPILLIENPVKMFNLISRFYISTLYNNKTFLFNVESSGPISVLLLDQTPLYVNVGGKVYSYLLKPPREFPVYGSYNLSTGRAENNELHVKLYVEYIYNYSPDLVNEFFKDIYSYTENNIIRSVDKFKINIMVSNGTLIYGSTVFKKMCFINDNYTSLYDIIYKTEKITERYKQTPNYQLIILPSLLVICIALSYLLLRKMKKL